MTDQPGIAKIAVAAATYWIDRPYDYRIPDDLAGRIRPGMRVTVPFGRGNRRTEGMVLALDTGPAGRELKPVSGVLDREPILAGDLLRLCLWMRERYFCTVYEAIHAMLPAGLWYTMEPFYSLAGGVDRPQAYAAAEGEEERLALDVLYAHGGSCPAQRFRQAFEGADPSRALLALVRKGIVVPDRREKRRRGDKTAAMVALAVPPDQALEYAEKKERRAPAQAAVLRLLCTLERVSLDEIRQFTGASRNTVAALEKAGLAALSREEIFRRPAYERGPALPMPELTAEQQEALDGIRRLRDGKTPSACLLYGVTGSGKTTVYIQLIRSVLQEGRSAMLLVPEIALTPQMIRIFSSYFGEEIAILHSSLSVGERCDEWKRIRSGRARVVIGTRSAVFAPCRDLGVIILDEEQEYSYKSENSPRYHAREVAKFRCSVSGAFLELGSATPDLESRWRAEKGAYHMFTLTRRYNQRGLPAVEIVDMKQELRAGNGGALSRRLLECLEATAARGEQSILFLNRRGTYSLVSCGECGFTYSCPRCSVSLTLHAAAGRLICHHCGFSRKLDMACPECGGRLHHYGIGTQKLEEELRQALPGVGVLRMDADSVAPAGSHESILSRFYKEGIPILLGTQMVAKGLDFENVTLVGVVSADQALYCGNYRASERCFSLLTQVVGRSGRGDRTGRAIIQTFTPENQVICLAARQDYEAFYRGEIQLRQLQNCPPFADIVTVTASGLDEDLVLRCCAYVRELLTEELAYRQDTQVLGPAPLPVVRVNNRYRYRVSVHGSCDRELRRLVSGILIHCNTAKEYRGVSVYADINPME